MSRSLRLSPSSTTSIVLMIMTGACGHSSDTLDAYEQSKSGISQTPGGVAPVGVSPDPVAPNPSVPDGPQFDCSMPASQQFDPATMKAYHVPADVAAKVDSALSVMTTADKATQMMGVDTRDYRDIERSPDVTVPGLGTIRGYRYRDAGRGVNLDAGQDNRTSEGVPNYATVFPTPSLRAASFDLDLERRIGAAIGDETAASLNNMLLAPCMNIIRHPYWGRTQEVYGEDMYHIGRMSTAFTVGIQEYVVACAKHWAANNIELKRATQDAVMSEQTLREVYGRHFEMVVQDGAVGCIMASYNKVNGVKAVLNRHLLRDVLKAPKAQQGFGFEGVVLTDWWAMPGDQLTPDVVTAQSVTDEGVVAGTDIEVPWTLYYSQQTLANVDPTLVDEAARRVLTQKFLFNTAMEGDPWGLKQSVSTLDDKGSIATNIAHEDLAEEAVIKSAVLVANGLGEEAPVLPLPAEVASLAVVGIQQQFSQVSSSLPKSCGASEFEGGQGEMLPPRTCNFYFATDPNLGDRGSSRVNGDPARAKGPFTGIQEVAGPDRTVTRGTTAADVADAEVAVVVVGYTPGDEGEEYYIAAGGDRSSLNLPPGHNELVSEVLDLNKPTVIIIQSGSIVNLPWLNHSNKKQATFWTSYPGIRGGTAMGKLIFGVDGANFSGKMPMAWPAEEELPVFKETDTVTNMGYFFGYREYDRRQYVEGEEVNLLFPFGHGLSYSKFEYSNVTVPCQEAVSKEAIFNVGVKIKNTSAVAGDEVAMLFVKPPPKPAGVTGERPWKELKGFARVTVPAMGEVDAQIPLRIQDLRRWEGGADGKWVIDSGEYTLMVGKNAADAETSGLTATVTVNGD